MTPDDLKRAGVRVRWQFNLKRGYSYYVAWQPRILSALEPIHE